MCISTGESKLGHAFAWLKTIKNTWKSLKNIFLPCWLLLGDLIQIHQGMVAHWYVTGLILFPHFLNLQQSLSSPVLLHTTHHLYLIKGVLWKSQIWRIHSLSLSLRAILLLIVNEFPTLALLEVTLAIILYTHPFLYNILDCVLMLMERRFSLSLSRSLSYTHF